MSCEHRFISELIPQWPIKYLFIGTFNPSWNNSLDNASYFYGRSKNDFWYIMPRVFEKNSLYDNRQNKNILIEFVKENKIGITDIVRSLLDADEKNNKHMDMVIHFEDKKLEEFKLIFNTDNIIELIEKNRENLSEGGVYLTRSSFDGVPKIEKEWNKIKSAISGIHYGELVTPSKMYRRITKEQKTENWKKIIKI